MVSNALSQIALDSLGNPYITWTDYSPGNADIFLSEASCKCHLHYRKVAPLLAH
jgi:hypothetical protein